MANGPVEALDIPPVTGDMGARRDDTIVIDEIGGRIVGIVGEHRGIPDQKRRSLPLAGIDEGLDWLKRLAADRQAVVAVPLATGHPRGEAAPRKIPLPPLAGLERPGAVGGKERRERRPGGEVPIHRLASLAEEALALRRVPRQPVAAGGIVADDPVLMGKATGDQRRQARAAEARRDIPATVEKAFPCHPVEVGRPQVGMAHEGVVAPVLIVGDYQEDVRPVGDVRGRAGPARQLPPTRPPEEPENDDQPEAAKRDHGAGSISRVGTSTNAVTDPTPPNLRILPVATANLFQPRFVGGPTAWWLPRRGLF